MAYSVYIIYSPSLDQYYVGQTHNLSDRLFRHKNAGSKSTKKVSDWILVYSEQYDTRSDAMLRENQIKRRKSRQFIETLINCKK
jgi:putative endonuclease